MTYSELALSRVYCASGFFATAAHFAFYISFQINYSNLFYQTDKNTEPLLKKPVSFKQKHHTGFREKNENSRFYQNNHSTADVLFHPNADD